MNNAWSQLKKPILALAPMEGVTDSAFRNLCRSHGADIVYTEFISSDAIGRGARTALRKMQYDPTEQPVLCQIFGRDPEYFAKAAQEIEKRGFAGIDLNFGCPAKKVVGHGMGVALLRDPQHARRLIEAVLEKITIPLSIKVRASIRKEAKGVLHTEERWTALDLLDAIQDLPLAAIIVHGRSFEGGFTGDVDTDMIKAMKQRFTGVVLANGGIKTPEDAKRMLEATGADGVGIARGAQGQPWIFRQTRQLLDTGTYTAPTWDEIVETALLHGKYLFDTKGTHGVLELRKHLAWYITGIPGAAELRAKLVRVETLGEAEKILASVN